MRQPQKNEGFFWRRLKLANALLMLLLAALAFCLYCIYAGKTIPVPEIFIDAIEKKLAENGIVAECSDMRLGLDFSIVARDIEFKEYGSPHAFFRAKSACAGLSIRRLFAGEMPVRYAAVAGGAVAGGAKGAPVFDNIDLMARFGRSGYSLDFLRARFFNAEILLRGKIQESYSFGDFEQIAGIIAEKFGAQKSGKPAPSAPAAAESIEARIGRLAAAKEYLGMFSSPLIEADFGFLAGGANFLKIEIYAEKAIYGGEKFSLELGGISASLNYANTNTRERISVSASAESAVCAGCAVSARKVLFKSGVHINEREIALFDVGFSASDIEFDGSAVGSASLEKKMLSSGSYGGGWRFMLARGADRLRGSLDIAEGGGVECAFEGNINPDFIFKRRELADIPELADFDFPSGIYLRGSAKLAKGARLPEVEVFVESSGCKIMRLEIDSVMAEASFDGEVLRCENIAAKTVEGWGARGGYTQNFKTNAYDIEVRGTIRPMAISHFMEPWWGKIMGAFEFADKAQMPYADVRVEGAWGSPENIWCFGFVDGENALYNGSKFDAFSMFVWVNPQRITLYDIQMLAGGGERKGQCFIEWLYDAGAGLTSFDRQRLFLRSGLSPAELVSLGGDDAKEVFDVVKFENPPQITLNALMFNPKNNPQKRADLFNAEISAGGDVSVEGIEFQNPHFYAASDKIDTDISGASFIFCGGDAKGSAHLKRADGTMLVSGEASASKMNQGLFFKFLSSLGGGESSGGESALGGDGNGEVSAGLKIGGDAKNMRESNGGGYVEIDSRDFLKLNIFGGISKAFASIGLPVGSFDITKVKTDFEIGGGELKLSPIEFTGPAMRIVGASVYSFKDDLVRGELKAYPFAKMENRIVNVVNKIVNPIMDSVRITVEGSLEKPKFWAKITPADIITNEKKVIEKIDESL